MTDWDEVALRVELAGGDERTMVGASPVALPSRPSLVVVDHFDLSMIDMPVSGARVRIVQVTKVQAIELAQRHGAALVASNERGLSALERELNMSPSPRHRVGQGAALLVYLALSWTDKRWYHVTYEGDVSE